MPEKPTRPRRVRARTVEWSGRPGGPCAQCGAEVEHLEIDHVIPFFEGGKHHLSNIQWLCHACHVKKSAEEVRRHRVMAPHLYERAPMPPDRRKAVSDFFRGRPRTAEHEAKIREGVQRAWDRKTPEERRAFGEKVAAGLRGKKRGPMTEERRRKIGEAQKRAWERGRQSSPRPNELLDHPSQLSYLSFEIGDG